MLDQGLGRIGIVHDDILYISAERRLNRSLIALLGLNDVGYDTADSLPRLLLLHHLAHRRGIAFIALCKVPECHEPRLRKRRLLPDFLQSCGRVRDGFREASDAVVTLVRLLLHLLHFRVNIGEEFRRLLNLPVGLVRLGLEL